MHCVNETCLIDLLALLRSDPSASLIFHLALHAGFLSSHILHLAPSEGMFAAHDEPRKGLQTFLPNLCTEITLSSLFILSSQDFS